jgi:hypothetical protein
LLDKTRAADPERDSLAEVLRMLEGIGATSPMKTGEIIREVEKRKDEAPGKVLNGVPGQGEPVEWYDLLCRIGRDGSPNVRRLGNYLAKNKGRIMGGLQLISKFDTDAKVNRYCVRRVENAPDYGVTGLNGVSDSSFLSREKINETHGEWCESEFYNKV